MIVLDATNKSLKLKSFTTSGTNTVNATVVVSYWSVDASNVWTPHQLETVFTSTNMAVSAVEFLPAPSAGESKVVENIWIRLLTTLASGQSLDVLVDAGGAEHFLARAGAVPNWTVNQTFIMGRDGRWDLSTGT